MKITALLILVFTGIITCLAEPLDPEKLKDRIPTLIKNGKRVFVSKQEFIEAERKKAGDKKYVAIAVPDG